MNDEARWKPFLEYCERKEAEQVRRNTEIFDEFAKADYSEVMRYSLPTHAVSDSVDFRARMRYQGEPLLFKHNYVMLQHRWLQRVSNISRIENEIVQKIGNNLQHINNKRCHQIISFFIKCNLRLINVFRHRFEGDPIYTHYASINQYIYRISDSLREFLSQNIEQIELLRLFHYLLSTGVQLQEMINFDNFVRGEILSSLEITNNKSTSEIKRKYIYLIAKVQEQMKIIPMDDLGALKEISGMITRSSAPQ